MSSNFDQYWLRIRKDDEQALETLYKLAFSSLARYAYAITGQKHLAEEVVQDVLINLWQNRSLIVIQGSFTSYLFRSVHNYALNCIRKQNTLKQSVNQVVTKELWEFISNNYDMGENFIDWLYAEDTSILVEKAIEELPEQCRHVFRLSRFEFLSIEEIAGKLNLSENTIKTHIYRALQKISGKLGNNS